MGWCHSWGVFLRQHFLYIGLNSLNIPLLANNHVVTKQIAP